MPNKLIKSENALANTELYYRRCHICAELSSANERITECQSCGKKMAPFYYFDEKKMPVYTDNRFSPEEIGAYKSLKGFAVYW